jgi:hypothetical protein
LIGVREVGFLAEEAMPKAEVRSLVKPIQGALNQLLNNDHAPRDIGRAWLEAGQTLVAEIPPQPPDFYSELADAVETVAQRWRNEAKLLRAEARRR